MIQERHRERSERMISVFGDVLAVAREAQTVDSGDDWRLRFGIVEPHLPRFRLFDPPHRCFAPHGRHP